MYVIRSRLNFPPKYLNDSAHMYFTLCMHVCARVLLSCHRAPPPRAAAAAAGYPNQAKSISEKLTQQL